MSQGDFFPKQIPINTQIERITTTRNTFSRPLPGAGARYARLGAPGDSTNGPATTPETRKPGLQVANLSSHDAKAITMDL